MVKIAKKKKKNTKLTRAEMKGPDQFQEASTKGAEWLSDNRVPVAAVITAIFVISLGIYLFQVMSNGKAYAVTTELTETLKIVEGKVESKKKDKKDTKDAADTTDDDTKTYKTEKAKNEAASKAIAKQLKSHSGAKASAFLRLFLANSQYKLGEYKKAVTSYQAFLSKLNPKDPIYVMGVNGLLRAAEAGKQTDVGVKAMKDFIAKGAKSFRPLAAMRLAEFYERNKDNKNASIYYKQLADSKTLQEMSGLKKLSITLTQLQTQAKRRLALLP